MAMLIDKLFPIEPCILWAAPFCLHDSSSGACIQVRTMLQQLTKRGMRCQAVGALTFDSPNGTALFPHLDDELTTQDQSWFTVEEKGIHYQYLNTKSRMAGDMTRDEESEFFRGFLNTLVEARPEAVFLFGGSPLEMAIINECKRRGIQVICAVMNGNYANYHFPNVDLLLTDAALTAKNYYANSRINIMPTGTFLEPEAYLLTKEIEPTYITFINPSSAKGISLVMRLALMAKKRHPDWKFLVVESRGTFASALALYKQNPKDFDNLSVATHTTDIRLVFEKTKCLLVPSLWYEGFGRVAVEAMINGIPVLASTSGGLPEAVNGGGMNLKAPETCTNDWEYFPSEEEMTEWFEALENIMDDANYPAWQEKAKEASKAHDIEKATDRLLAYITPLLNKRPSFHPQYFIK